MGEQQGKRHIFQLAIAGQNLQLLKSNIFFPKMFKESGGNRSKSLGGGYISSRY